MKRNQFYFSLSALISQGIYFVLLFALKITGYHVALCQIGLMISGSTWLSLITSCGLRQSYGLLATTHYSKNIGQYTVYLSKRIFYIQNILSGGILFIIYALSLSHLWLTDTLQITAINAIILLFLGGNAITFSELAYQYLIYQEHAVYFFIFKSLQAGTWLFCALLGMCLNQPNNMGVGLFVGFLISQCIPATIIMYLFLFYKDMPMEPLINTKKQVALGLQHLPSVAAHWSISYMPRWFLASMHNYELLTLWSIIEWINPLLHNNIIVPISQAYWPGIMKTYQQKGITGNDGKELLLGIQIARIGFIISSIIYILGLILLYQNPSLPLTISAYSTMYLLSCAQWINAITYFATPYIQFMKKINLISGSLVIGALVQYPVLFMSFNLVGLLACACATSIAYLMYLINLLIVRHYLQITVSTGTPVDTITTKHTSTKDHSHPFVEG